MAFSVRFCSSEIVFILSLFFYFLKDFIYFQRGEWREKERERELSMCGCLSCGPHWGPGPQPRHVPCLGIQPASLWFAVRAQSSELCQPGLFCPFFFFKDFIYLFLERGEGVRKRGRETSVCVCLLRAPDWGPGQQPRHVPCLGIEPPTLWFRGQLSTH